MLIEETVRRDPFQIEFQQCITEQVNQLAPVFDRFPKYAWVMKQLLEPERVIQFRVPWLDDSGTPERETFISCRTLAMSFGVPMTDAGCCHSLLSERRLPLR